VVNLRILLGGRILEVIQQAAAAADEHQQPAAAGVVLLVRLQMVCEIVDPLRKHGDLNFGRSGVAVGAAVLVDGPRNPLTVPTVLATPRLARTLAPAD
jgi:hypothetical protein